MCDGKMFDWKFDEYNKEQNKEGVGSGSNKWKSGWNRGNCKADPDVWRERVE